MNKKVIILDEISDSFLDTFDRYQETRRVYYIDEDGNLKVKDDYYVDEWDLDKKKNIVKILRYYLSMDGLVMAIMDNLKLLGFAALNGKAMGSKKQYHNLGFIHVSKDYRGRGIGKVLFKSMCKEAKKRGCKKLYIGANPAVDTYNFYKVMGCELATEIINEIYKHEPLDLQLEYDLYKS